MLKTKPHGTPRSSVEFHKLSCENISAGATFAPNNSLHILYPLKVNMGNTDLSAQVNAARICCGSGYWKPRAVVMTILSSPYWKSKQLDNSLPRHLNELTHLPLVPHIYVGELDHSSLFQIMASRLDGAKPLFKPILTCCQLGLKEHISMKFYLKFKYFHSRKCLWTCRPRNGSHFVQGEMN